MIDPAAWLGIALTNSDPDVTAVAARHLSEFLKNRMYRTPT
jgi:hypothetical protein